MHIVSAIESRYLFRRGSVTSRILLFTLRQLGIEDFSFRSRFAEAVLASPFDAYDPALAAEEVVRKEAPLLYKKHEAEWLLQWDSLHETSRSPNAAGPAFWLERLGDHPLQAALRTMRPYRQRCCRRYLASPGPTEYSWRVVDRGTPVFTQQVADARARVRRFPAPPMNILKDNDLLRLVAMICELVSYAPRTKATSLEVTMHLMLTHAGVDGGKPAPEGMHQDGANYIVSAIVLERRNISGGISVITLANEKGPPAIDSVELSEGQGIFQADLRSNLWHGVTPIHRIDPNFPAYRSIVGFDITIPGEG